MGKTKVLITGAGGFIGSHLTEYLVERGYSVRALVRYTSTRSHGWLAKSPVHHEIEFFYGDIRDPSTVSKALAGAESVFHLAALIGIPYSYETPLSYLRTNTEGTYNVLEAAKDLSVSRVFVTSTSEVYGSALYQPIDEKHPLQPQSPYSASKISADALSLSYFHSFGLPVTLLRPFNTFGPRQSERAIIPAIISQVLSGAKEIRLGALTPLRDFTYIEDTVRAFEKLLNTVGIAGEVFNIGSGSEISIQGIADKILTLMGTQMALSLDNDRLRPETSEVQRLICNSQKLQKATGWKPTYSLESGLKKTIEWMKRFSHTLAHGEYVK